MHNCVLIRLVIDLFNDIAVGDIGAELAGIPHNVMAAGLFYQENPDKYSDKLRGCSPAMSA
jgi:hypothetical protein